MNLNIIGDPKPKLSLRDYQRQTAYARDFALRRGLVSGQNTIIPETGAPFIDANTGKEIPFGQQTQKYSPNTIIDIKKVPYYVKTLEYDGKNNTWFYEDEKTGDYTPVSHEIAYSSRFQPNRGKANQSIMAYAQKLKSK